MRRFTQVDVFSDELGMGNALAVVHDADGLNDAQLARFARWTQLSETTFLLPPADVSADYRVRIFTTAGELPFAGHPTLGSARAWLAAGGAPRSDVLVQECGVGLVRVRVDGPRLAFAAPPLRRSGPLAAAEVRRLAGALGLSTAQVVDARHADNGPGWVALLLDSAESVLGIDYRAGMLGEEKVGVVGPMPPGGPADFEVRAFVPGIGVGEDAVTGSLNAALAQWLIGAGVAPPSYVAAQGTAMGRRGRVFIDTVGADIWVGGHTVVGVAGTVAL